MLEELWDRVWLNPRDDEARRVLADALLEAGDPRGELIAVQCRLAAVEADERGPELEGLERRERELLDAHGAEWAKGWPFELMPHFARGFPERQHAPVMEMVRSLGKAQEVAPTLSELVFTDEEPRAWEAGLRMFVAAHRDRLLERLTLPVTFSGGDVQALVELQVVALRFMGGSLSWLPELSKMGLRELAFEFDMGVQELPPSPQLRVLINRGNRLRAVPESPDLERLTLDRVDTRVVPARFPKLRRLELLDTRLGRRSLMNLLEPGHASVRRLGLRGEKVDADVVALLERWPALEVLDMRGCTVPPRALDAPVVQRLRCLIT